MMTGMDKMLLFSSIRFLTKMLQWRSHINHYWDLGKDKNPCTNFWPKDMNNEEKWIHSLWGGISESAESGREPYFLPITLWMKRKLGSFWRFIVLSLVFLAVCRWDQSGFNLFFDAIEKKKELQLGSTAILSLLPVRVLECMGENSVQCSPLFIIWLYITSKAQAI